MYVCVTTLPAVTKGRQQRLSRAPQCYAVTWMGKKASDVMIALGECTACTALEYTGGPSASNPTTVAEPLPAAPDMVCLGMSCFFPSLPACHHVCYAQEGIPLLVLHNHTECLCKFTHSTHTPPSLTRRPQYTLVLLLLCNCDGFFASIDSKIVVTRR